MKRRAAQAVVQGPGLGAVALRHLRHGVQPLNQGAQIEPCTSGHDGQLAFGVSGLDFGQRHHAPARGGAALRPRQDAIEPVRHLAHGLEPGPGGEDRKLAVDLHRIGVDDHTTEFLGQGERQTGFAAGRGPGHDEQRSLSHMSDASSFPLLLPLYSAGAGTQYAFHALCA